MSHDAKHTRQAGEGAPSREAPRRGAGCEAGIAETQVAVTRGAGAGLSCTPGVWEDVWVRGVGWGRHLRDAGAVQVP